MARTLSFTLLNRMDEIDRLFALSDGFAAEHRFSEADRHAVGLALEEIVINVVRHGFDHPGEHKILVDMSLDDDNVLTIRVEDEGRPFNPLDHPPPDLSTPAAERPIGGLGIFLARQNVDNMQSHREGGRNILIMTKTLSLQSGDGS